MAETINVPYIAIVQAALIPAILYFATAFWMVHLEAGRKGPHGLPKDECPNPWTAVRLRWYLLLPWWAWWYCCSRATRRCSRARWAWG